MTLVDLAHLDRPDAGAAAARSILSCPSGASITVDGVDDVLAGGELGLQDLDGVPTFTCGPESPLALAAAQGRAALVTLDSGLGDSRSAERDLTLRIAGPLEHAGAEECACCHETRVSVVLHVHRVLLVRRGTGQRVRISPEEFASPAHRLNAGHLQSSLEHANTCHQDELRRAVATLTRRRLAEVVGVALGDLTPQGVEVRWVGVDGAHSETLTFPRTARCTDDLGRMLRTQLHAGLC